MGEASNFEEAAAQDVFLAALVHVGLQFKVWLEHEAGVALGDTAEIVSRGYVEVDRQRQGARVGLGWILR